VVSHEVGQVVARLGPNIAAAAKQSVGAALGVANQIGGPTGAALRQAASSAFMDGFALALLVTAGLMVVGAIAVLFHLPDRDVSTAPAQPDSRPEQTASTVAS
jgi:DHA2 family multidrug resistance protein-like MFS transporter